MTASEKSHQNLSDYNQFLFKKRFQDNKDRFFLIKKLEIQIIVFMIMLTRSSERIFIRMRYTGIYVYNHDKSHSYGIHHFFGDVLATFVI